MNISIQMVNERHAPSPSTTYLSSAPTPRTTSHLFFGASMSVMDTCCQLFVPVPRSCLDAGSEWDELEAVWKLHKLVLRLRGGAADASSCEGDKGLEWREGEGKGEGEGKVLGLMWDGDMKGRKLSIEGVAGLKFQEQSDEGKFEGVGDDLDSARSPCVILLPMCAALAP